jgi:hypothetical protein
MFLLACIKLAICSLISQGMCGALFLKDCKNAFHVLKRLYGVSEI